MTNLTTTQEDNNVEYNKLRSISNSRQNRFLLMDMKPEFLNHLTIHNPDSQVFQNGDVFSKLIEQPGSVNYSNIPKNYHKVPKTKIFNCIGVATPHKNYHLLPYSEKSIEGNYCINRNKHTEILLKSAKHVNIPQMLKRSCIINKNLSIL